LLLALFILNGSGAFAEGKLIKGGGHDGRLPYDYAKARAEASCPVARTNFSLINSIIYLISPSGARAVHAQNFHAMETFSKNKTK
jgi:hypothetical protein